MQNNLIAQLHQAIDEGDLATIVKLLESGLSVNEPTSKGCTPLMIAVMPSPFEDPSTPHATLAIVELLLSHGANPALCDNFGLCARDYLAQQLDPNWVSEYGFKSPALQWSAADLEIIEQIRSRLDGEQAHGKQRQPRPEIE